MKHYILFFFLAVSTYITSAQQGIGLHFMNTVAQSNLTNPGQFNKYRINVSLPSVQVGYFNSAFRLSDIYEVEGNTMFFDFSTAIDQMDDLNNTLQFGTQVDPLAISLQFGKIQVGVSYGLKGQANLVYPKGLFQFIWYGNEGVDSEVLPFGPKIDMQTYHEIGVNFAYQVNDQLSVGTRVRALNGIFALHTERSTIELLTDQEEYSLTARTDYNIKGSGVSFDPFEINADDALANFFGGNSGFAVDFGATYQVTDKLEIQASIIDLGFIQWDQDLHEASSEGSLEIEAYDLAALINDGEEDGDLIDTLKQIFNFEVTNGASAFRTNLGAKTYLSATYEPIKNLFVGGLFYGEQTRGGFSPAAALSINKVFGHIFSIGGVYTARENSFANLGLNTSLRLGGFQLFGTVDNVVDLTRGNYYNLRMGINLAFGKPKPVLLPNDDAVVPVE